MNLRAFAVAPALFAALAVACGAESAPPRSPAAPPPSASGPADSAGALSSTRAPAKASSQATVEDARAFLATVDKDLHHLWASRDRAAWISETYITDDTGESRAAAEEETAAYMTRAITESHRFDGLDLPPELARQLKLLRLSQTVPAPSDAAERSELATIEARMTQAYGAGKFCPPRLKGKCWHIDEISRILRTSRNPEELREAWEGWQLVGQPMRADYARYVELANKGAKEIGYDDVGALWRSTYDMTPKELEDDVERMWTEVKPLYEDLHCYARARLRQKYGAKVVPEHAPIRADLLGDLWAQEWSNDFDMLEPYKGEAPLDVGKKLKDGGYDAAKMVKLGERFFTSLGFQPLPETFWTRSMLTRPRDREVVCHASAWDVSWNGDLRVKMCIEPTWEDLVTIHHELGHDFYFQSYDTLPILFQQGANAGFHEAIGDTLALSVTPAYLKSLGLVDTISKTDHGRINTLMKSAVDKIAFLPFGLLVDKWRWDVFSGKTLPDKYNEAWWALRAKYQGVAPPSPRGEQYFDAGAKFHVPASSMYVIYFLARIYQFQFHRALCKAAGYTGPLDQCSIYGNKEAGEKLRAMLSLGASKSWQDALFAMSGERKADASAMVEFYAPLRAYIKDQIKGEQCGW